MRTPNFAEKAILALALGVGSFSLCFAIFSFFPLDIAEMIVYSAIVVLLVFTFLPSNQE